MCSVICCGRNESRQQVFKRKKTVTREKHVSGCGTGCRGIERWRSGNRRGHRRNTRGAGEEVGGDGHVTATEWKGVIIVNDSGKSCGTLEVNDNESCWQGGFWWRGRHTIAWLATVTAFSKALDKAHTYHAIMDGTCGSSGWARDLDCYEKCEYPIMAHWS